MLYIWKAINSYFSIQYLTYLPSLLLFMNKSNSYPMLKCTSNKYFSQYTSINIHQSSLSIIPLIVLSTEVVVDPCAWTERIIDDQYHYWGGNLYILIRQLQKFIYFDVIGGRCISVMIMDWGQPYQSNDRIISGICAITKNFDAYLHHKWPTSYTLFAMNMIKN